MAGKLGMKGGGGKRAGAGRKRKIKMPRGQDGFDGFDSAAWQRELTEWSLEPDELMFWVNCSCPKCGEQFKVKTT